jgi:hypothetical protein
MTASVAGLRLAYSLLCALRAQEVAYEVISSFFATVVADSLVIEGNVSAHIACSRAIGGIGVALAETLRKFVGWLSL